MLNIKLKFKKICWLCHRTACWFIALIIALLVTIYLLMVSSGFITKAILPVISHFAGIEINAEKFQISPFRSRVEISEFRIGKAEQPLLTIMNFKGSWRLWQNISGNLNAENIEASGVNIWVHRSIPFFMSDETESPEKTKKQPDVRFDLRNIAVRDAKIRIKRDDSEITLNINSLHLPQLKNDVHALLSTDAAIDLFLGEQLKVNGQSKLECGFTIDRQLKPSQIDLELRTKNISGTAEGFQLKDDNLNLHIQADKEAERTRLHIFEIQHLKNGELRSLIKADGLFDRDANSGHLNFSIIPLSHEIIRPAVFAVAGFDPGLPELTFNGKLDYSGKRARGVGNIILKNRGVTIIGTEKLRFPEWDMNGEYEFNADFAKKELRLNRFSLTANDRKSQAMKLVLGANPLYFSWNNPNQPMLYGKDAAWDLNINLNPAVFNPLLAPYRIYFGDGALNLQLAAKLSEQRPGFDFHSNIEADKLFIRLDEYDLELKKTDYTATVDGAIDPLGRMFTIDKTELWQRDAKGSLGHAVLTGQWDLQTFVLDARVKIDDFVSRAIAPQPMIPDFVREIIDNVMNKFHPADYKFEGHAILDLWNGFLKVPEALLKFHQPPDRNIQSLKVNNFYINWDRDLIMGPCIAELDLTNFMVSQVNSWVPPESSFCRNGLLSGKLTYFMNGIATEMTADAQLKFKGLELNAGKINFPEINFLPAFKVSLKNYELLELDKFEFDILRNNDTLAQMKIAPSTGSISEPENAPKLNATIQINRLPLTELNAFYPTEKFCFTDGTMDAQIHGLFAKFGRSVELSGILQQRDNEFRINDKPVWHPVNAKTAFAILLENFQHINIKNVHSTIDDKINLELSRSNFDLPFENAVINGRIAGLKTEFIEPLYPWLNAIDATVSADIAMSSSGTPSRFACDSQFKISGFKRFGAANGIDGNGTVNFIRTPETVSSQGKLNLDRMLDLKWNGSRHEKDPAAIDITVAQLDLELLQNFLKTNNPVQESPLPPPPEPVYDFSNTPFNINLQMNGITYSELNKLNLNARVAGTGKRVVIEPIALNINNTPIQLRGETISEADGIRWQLSGTFSELDLDPLTTPFFEGDYKNIAGIAENARFNISGHGVRFPRFWDNLEGEWLASYRNVVIPNEFQQTVLGRIFFLPFQLIGELKTAVFGVPSTNQRLKNIFSRVVQSRKNVEFSHGIINASASDGRINLDKVLFTGDFVKELKFDGYLGFGSDQRMLVHSRINLEETILPLTIRGTVYHPEPDYAKAIVQFTAINTGSLLRGVTDIFSSNFLQSLIETLTGKTARKNIYTEPPTGETHERN
ncbi:MAG: hypothetical protein GX280_05490 [Lentisphaerae bacterium]|nr:hypothetical protein [Lentisphaerota bacterium]